MRYDHTPVTTTNATPTRIALVEVPEYFGGLLEVTVVAKEDTGALGSLGCKQIVTFDKSTTLLLGTPVDILPIEDDIGTGGFIIQVDGDENIEVVATGLAYTVINWAVRTDYLSTNATTPP